MKAKVTPEAACEAVLMCYLKKLHKERHERPSTTAEIAAYLGCSAATVRNVLTPMEPIFQGSTEKRRAMAIPGVDLKRGGSAGYGCGAYPDTWEPSWSLVCERLAAGLAMGGES